MLPTVTIYSSSNRHQTPSQFDIDSEKSLTISENDYVYIEIRSSKLLSNDCFLWLSDFKFGLTFLEQNAFGFIYALNLNTFFLPEDAVKFSHRFSTSGISKMFFKIFLNYYGECTVEFEGLGNDLEFKFVGKINIDSDKISEIDTLLDYLLLKDHYYWNTVSLTKVEASDKLKEEENIIWTLKKLEQSLRIFSNAIIPHLSDSIGRLIPIFNVENLEETSVISEESLLWLIENCNVIEPSNIYSENSFLLLNRPYKINEILVQTLHIETDVVENQVIHGYVNDVFRFFNLSLLSIEKSMVSLNDQNDFRSQIFRSYYQRLTDTINILKTKTLNIKNTINNLIPVSREHLSINGSSRFQSKQHYHEAYIQISGWINRNEAVFSTEQLFSGAKDISKLYEIYCLFKIIDSLTIDFGFQLDYASDEQLEEDSYYDILNSKRSNLKSKYVFTHPLKHEKISLYYELLPDNLTTVAKGINRGYRPDFILELENTDSVKYIILDAKYKKIGTIQSFDYQELTLKYIHGIGMKKGGYFPLLGMFIINPIDKSEISYYQKTEFSSDKSKISLPLIGRVEMGTTKSQSNHFKELLVKLIELS